MAHLGRRSFLKGCGTAAITAGGAPTAWASLSPEVVNIDLLIYVFLRGGMDGLNLSDAHRGPRPCALRGGAAQPAGAGLGG